jgi:arylsulfatase
MELHHYTRRDFLEVLGLGVGALAVTGCTGAFGLRAGWRQRPNIVLIMADDMGYSDIGCYGGEIRTHNLDALAAGGLRFTQFYNTARCCPTRASLMTGLYPHQAGVGHMMEDKGYDAYRGELNNRCVTIAEVLKQAGYSTYMAGKWHVTKSIAPDGDKHNWPCQRGFDRFFGTIHGAGSYYDPNSLTRDNTQIPPGDDFYYTDAIRDNAVKFIHEHAAENPFFMYVAFTAPHWPMHALPEDVARYKGRYGAGWDALRAERHKRMIGMGIVEKEWEITPRDSSVPSWTEAEDKEWYQRRMEVYAAMVDRLDQGVGRIISELKRTGRFENTLIFFLADNGGCAEEYGSTGPVKPEPSEPADLKPMGEDELQTRMQPLVTRDGRPVRTGHGVMPGPADTYLAYGKPWANASNTPFRLYKHWVHEGGISTPLIAHWPVHIKVRCQLRHQPGHLIDIMATCVDVAGAKYPAEYKGNRITPMEGKSLLPAFDNKPVEREAIYWEHEGNRAIRQGKWKLVSRHPGRWELYDLEADRTELTDLAGKYPEKVEQLKAMYESWAARCGVQPWPVNKPAENKSGKI